VLHASQYNVSSQPLAILTDQILHDNLATTGAQTVLSELTTIENIKKYCDCCKGATSQPQVKLL
jgi:hypothetical protein